MIKDKDEANHHNNKRIAKNTFIVYIRMLLVLAVTLFTVKIVLRALGVVDYGIYNVVAGLTYILLFVNSSLQLATLRFYSISIGERDSHRLNAIFNLSFFIYAIIALIVVILSETVGLWFLKNKMLIPDIRMTATLWIYQFSVVSFVISLLASPFTALIIAHEDIKIYAVISLIEAILKLVIAYLLLVLPFDRLFLYGMLMLGLSIMKVGVNIIFCKRKYKECFFRLQWDQNLFRSLFNYSSWTLIGTFSGVANSQGNNILLNLFFGPLANAARSVAFQVSHAVTLFSDNFFVSIRPPLIKSFAEKDYHYMMRLFLLSSKFSYCLLFLIFLPLMLETSYILNLWLDDVTEYMIIFTRLILVYSLILSLHSPITTLVQAAGEVKKYHLVVESMTLLSLPISYLLFKLGYPPQSTFYVSIVVFSLAHILRIVVLKKVIVYFSLREYFYKFIIPVFVITLLSSITSFFVASLLSYGFKQFIMTISASILLVSLFSLLFGFDKREKKQLFLIIRKKIK